MFTIFYSESLEKPVVEKSSCKIYYFGSSLLFCMIKYADKSHKVCKSGCVEAFACVVTILFLAQTSFLLWLWCTSQVIINPASASSSIGIQQKTANNQVSTSIFICI